MARCPTCEGTGEITRTKRDGVSVFPTIDGLYWYLAERGAVLGSQGIVELDGRLSEDEDLDADAGAVLIRPERVVSAHPLSDERLEAAQRRVEADHGS